MGITVNPLTKRKQKNKICPTPKLVPFGTDFEPLSQKKKQQKLEFEPPRLLRHAVLEPCMHNFMVIASVKQVQSLSSFDPFQSSGHTWMHSLAGAITQLSFL